MRRLLSMLIVAFGAAPAQQVPTRTLVEQLRIDGEAYQWSRISSVHVAANGSIFVVHPDDFGVSLFSASGKHVKDFARKGAGPGEARSIARSGILGDTLWMSDPALKRVTLFDANGTHIQSTPLVGGGDWLRSFRPSSAYVNIGVAMLFPSGVATGGGFLPWDVVPNRKLALLRMSRDGVANGVVANPDFGRAQMRVVIPNMNNALPTQPFIADPLIRYGPGGSQIALLDAETGGDPRISLTFVSLKGDTLRRTLIPYPAVAITKSRIDAVVDSMAQAIKRVGHEALIRSMVKTPKYDWPIRDAVIERDGTAWIRLRSADSLATWLIVNPQGKVVEQVRLPQTTSIVLVDRGIWAVTMDENDVPSVVKYRR